MKKSIIAIAIFSSICGCHRHETYADGGHSKRGLFNVNIVSDPPGVSVEQEGVYLGKTPLQLPIRTVCPPVVNFCRSIYLTATYHHHSMSKTVKLRGKNYGDIEVYFDFSE